VTDIRIVSDLIEFAQMGPVWDALVRAANPSHPFLTHDWFMSWWLAFGADCRPHILLLSDDDGRPMAIAPLMRRRTRMSGFSVEVIEPMLNDHTPRYEFILASRPSASCRAIWGHLRDEPAAWHLMFARQLPAGSVTLETLAECAEQDGFLVGRVEGDLSPHVPFEGTWPRYYATLSRNHRAKVNKGLNRLRRAAEVDLETVVRGDAVERALADGFRIEAAAWKQRRGSAIVSDASVERFYRGVAARAAHDGSLRLLFLNVGGRRIAFAFALESSNKLFVLKAGYDPEFARYSPYNLLCALVLQDGFARRLDEYEFLGANEDWKLQWTDHVRRHEWLYVFAPTLRMRMLYELKCRLLPALRRRPALVRVRDALFSSR
jgi:CelD/BcsL family acetyltransferase involved in cellulose biosynthesis